MSEAVVMPVLFARLYREFQASDSTDTLTHVLYFRENEKVYIYMKYLGILYKTVVSVENFENYVINFNNKIKLEENLS